MSLQNWTVTFFFLACLAYECRSNAVPTSANGYMDTVLNTALQYESRTRQLDPVMVPDFETNFEDRVAIIGKVKGHVKYTDGKLYGLSKARRLGECFGPITITNFKTYLNCTISLDNLNLEYRGHMKYGKLPTVSITAKANMTSMQVYVNVESYHRNPIPLITNFQFTKIGQVEAKFSGLGHALNKYLKFLDESFKQNAWKIFFDTVGKDFHYVLNQSVARVAFPWSPPF